MNLYTPDYWMNMALREAIAAYEDGEVPVGAIIVSNNKVLGKGHNQVERLRDVTAHAEMLAITAAANALGAKFLEGCTLYVTLEPCPMCAAALRWARVSALVYGASDSKGGYNQYGATMLHPTTEVSYGVLAKECGELVTDFFKALRQ